MDANIPKESDAPLESPVYITIKRHGGQYVRMQSSSFKRRR